MGSPVALCAMAAARTSFRVHLGERSRVDADLHEGRLDPGVVDAAFMLADPARRELRRRLGERVRRQVLVLVGAVVAGVREDVDARGLGQPSQQARIAAQIGRRALDQRRAAVRSCLSQERHGAREDGVGVVARRADRRGADEIDEHVLVHQRHAQLRGRNSTRRRWDRAGCGGASGRSIPDAVGGTRAAEERARSREPRPPRQHRPRGPKNFVIAKIAKISKTAKTELPKLISQFRRFWAILAILAIPVRSLHGHRFQHAHSRGLAARPPRGDGGENGEGRRNREDREGARALDAE